MSCQDMGIKPKGTRPTIRYNFTEAISGDPFDPTSIDIITKDPAGAQLTYDETDPEVYQDVVPTVGEWFFTFPSNLTQVGWWFVYANADGGVDERKFKITGVNVSV